MKLLPSRSVLCTPYNHAPCHFMQSHIRRVHACLTVTCHLHFWRKIQHKRLTQEKKILPPLLQGIEPATYQSRVRRCNHRAIPAPHHTYIGAQTYKEYPFQLSCRQTTVGVRDASQEHPADPGHGSNQRAVAGAHSQ